MADQQGPAIKLEPSDSTQPTGCATISDHPADSLPPVASATVLPSGSQARPVTKVPSTVPSTAGLQAAAGSELAQQQVVSAHTRSNHTNTMASILDGGSYSEREGRHETAHHAPTTIPYNQKFTPIPFTKDGWHQANRQYAGVPEAHNSTNGPAQLIQPEPPHSPQQDTGTSETASESRRASKSPPASKSKKASQLRMRIKDMVLPEMARPENSTMILNFTNLWEARHSVLNRNVSGVPPSPDPTIPTTNAQRAGYVLRLLLAMRNRNDVLDKDKASKRYNATGDDDRGGGYYYREEDMEKVCWEIVRIAENFHIHGPNILNIYDRETLKHIKQDIHLTFEERMQVLIKMLCFFKSKCDAFMKGSAIEEVVAQPVQKLTQAMGNRIQNDNRAVTLCIGRKARGKLRPLVSSPEPDDDGDDNEDGTDAGAGARAGARAEGAVKPLAPQPDTSSNANQYVDMQGQEEQHAELARPNTPMDTDDDDPPIKKEPTDSPLKAKFKRLATLMTGDSASGDVAEPEQKRVREG